MNEIADVPAADARPSYREEALQNNMIQYLENEIASLKQRLSKYETVDSEERERFVRQPSGLVRVLSGNTPNFTPRGTPPHMGETPSMPRESINGPKDLGAVRRNLSNKAF